MSNNRQIADLGNLNLPSTRKSSGHSNGPGFPRNSVLCIIGDSITLKDGYFTGAQSLLFGEGGPFEGWTVYNSAANGKRLRDYFTSIASGDQNAVPLNAEDTTTNLWRLVNADPAKIIIMLGTNDMRLLGGANIYATLAAAQTGMASDLTAVVEFLLERTSAKIELQTPPPFTFVAGSVSGFANFADANDAAARGLALRSLYRSFRNFSSRVSVLDLHSALYPAGTAVASMRWDSLAASVDPDTGLTIKLDELHLTPFGENIRARIMHRAYNSEVPASAAIKTVPNTIHQGGAVRATQAYIKAVGLNFIDFYSNTLFRSFGSILVQDQDRKSLSNIPRYKDVSLSGVNGDLFDFLRCTQFVAVDSLGAAATFSSFSVAHVTVDGINDYYRLTVTGTPTLATGLADLYIASVSQMPPVPPTFVGMKLFITGAAAQARDNIPITGINFPINNSTVQATRQSAPDAAVFGLYVSNVFNGSYDSANNTYDAGVPGLKLATVSLASGFLQSSSFTATSALTALGGVLPDLANFQSTLYAVKESGTMGDWATISIKVR
jgi:lysophospholipase L1-like esterase